MANTTSYSFSLLILFIAIAGCFAVSVEKDLTLTRSQKEALDRFKVVVAPYLTKDYQKADIYLIRWLRARNFNIQAAERLLLEDIEWRKKDRRDTIDQEGWSDFEQDYPYYLDGYDNEGKPILTANYDEWDVRKAVLSGKRERLMRWMTKGFEDATRRVRELQAEGKNVTQWDFIINMNNFNLVQHGCVQCLPIYTNFVTIYENHYPGSADKIILINTPQVFEVVLNLIRPIMSRQTREALKVYGNNKEEWESKLYSDIERDQLVPTYGGTKIRF